MGSRLQAYLKKERGSYTTLAQKMQKYRKPRKNGSKDEYNLVPLFNDGHNITVGTLTGLMRETGLPIGFFIDFEPGELSPYRGEGLKGNNNIINSSISNDLTVTVEHLNEVVRLKNELIADKERIIALKDSEIEQWKKRYDDLFQKVSFGESDKNGTH